MRPVLAIVLWLATSTAAAAVCMPYAAAIANLEQKYGESTVGIGLAGRDAAIFCNGIVP